MHQPLMLLPQDRLLRARYPGRGPDVMTIIAIHLNVRNWRIMLHRHQLLMLLLLLSQPSNNKRCRKRGLNVMVATTAHINARKERPSPPQTCRAQCLRYLNPQTLGHREEIHRLHFGSWMIRARQSCDDPFN